MSIKSRKKQLEELKKTAEQDAQIKKIAQEVKANSSSPEEYAKNFLKKLLQESEIHFNGEEELYKDIT